MKSISIGNLTLSMPVIQGGMGVGISLSGLASAVANADLVEQLAPARALRGKVDPEGHRRRLGLIHGDSDGRR